MYVNINSKVKVYLDNGYLGSDGSVTPKIFSNNFYASWYTVPRITKTSSTFSLFEPDVYALCLSTTPTQKLFCLYVFRHAGPPQWVNCLAPRREIALNVFPKDTATRYCIGSRTKVSQPITSSLLKATPPPTSSTI